MGRNFQRSHDHSAAIDRLVHHSIIIELNIPSYRLEQAKNNVQSLKDDRKEEPITTQGQPGELVPPLHNQ